MHPKTTGCQGLERRAAERYALRWPVSIASAPGAWVETSTENLSSRGFYCVLPVPIAPGFETECRIAMPAHGAREGGRSIRILCRIHIVRLQGAAGGYGLGCSIDDYIVAAGEE